jgi:hypothetical protein
MFFRVKAPHFDDSDGDAYGYRYSLGGGVVGTFSVLELM